MGGFGIGVEELGQGQEERRGWEKGVLDTHPPKFWGLKLLARAKGRIVVGKIAILIRFQD